MSDIDHFHFSHNNSSSRATTSFRQPSFKYNKLSGATSLGKQHSQDCILVPFPHLQMDFNNPGTIRRSARVQDRYARSAAYTNPPSQLEQLLPTEVRQLIWGIIVISSKPILITTTSEHFGTPIPGDRVHYAEELQAPEFSLTLVNRLIGSEASYVFYTQNVFTFGTGGWHVDWQPDIRAMARLFQATSWYHLSLIRRANFVIGCRYGADPNEKRATLVPRSVVFCNGLDERRSEFACRAFTTYLIGLKSVEFSFVVCEDEDIDDYQWKLSRRHRFYFQLRPENHLPEGDELKKLRRMKGEDLLERRKVRSLLLVTLKKEDYEKWWKVRSLLLVTLKKEDYEKWWKGKGDVPMWDLWSS